MFSKKSFIKLFSVGMILLQCNTSIVVKKPQLSNFLEIQNEHKQFDGLMQHMNIPNSAPAQANAISNSHSKGIAHAVDNSIAQVINAVKSTQDAKATALDDSAAIAVSSGNTELKTDAKAEKGSNALGVGVSATNGKSTADAEGGSIAVAANMNENKNENILDATNNSNVVGVSTSASDADSASFASQGSLADSKAIDKVDTSSNVKADQDSTAAVNTSNESLSTSNANAANSSKAQTVAESKSKAKTDIAAVEASKAAGNLQVKSGADSTGNAINGGNALSTSESNTTGDNTGCAENGSTVILNNKSENQANANSESNGTLPPPVEIPEVIIDQRPILPDRGPATLPSPILQASPISPSVCDERDDIVLRGGAQEEADGFCGDTPFELEGPSLRIGKDLVEDDCYLEDENEGIALRGNRNQEIEKRIPILRSRTDLETDDACRRAPRRNERLRSRRDRKLRRRALRQQGRRYGNENKACEEDYPFRRPTLRGPVIKTVPHVDLGAAANNFITNNANSIKLQSADHLAKIQDVLAKKTC